MVGKRKRRASLEGEDGKSADTAPQQDYHALLRAHFESAYEPLETDEVTAEDGAEDSDTSDEWGGISGDDENDGLDETSGEPSIEIIDHSVSAGRTEDANLHSARKAFMTSKLPSDVAIQAIRQAKTATDSEDPTSESSLLKNDLALQRLLRESKLLSSAAGAGSDAPLELSGKSRHKALDAHLQTLGAKTSIQTQKHMPRNQRIGITKKAVERETTRRSEAREAGVVLEKVKRGPSDTKRRSRSVGGPGVGKFRGGTLTLSAKDVRAIQGPAARTKGKKGRR